MTDQGFDFYTKEESSALLDRLISQRTINLDYVIVDQDLDLTNWIKKIEAESCFVALDTETKGLTPAPGMVKTIQLAYSPHVPVLIVKLPKIKDRTSLNRLLTNPKILKVGHHIKFDVLMLGAEGIEVKAPLMCTLLGIKILKSGTTNLSSLQFTAQDLLNIKLDKTEQNSDWTGELNSDQLQYAANDAGILVEILAPLQQQLNQANLLKIAILEYSCLLPLIKMQKRGICLDRDRWYEVKLNYQQQRDNLATKIHQEFGKEFNIASAPQLLDILQTYGINVKSTNSNVLVEWVKDYPIIAKIIKYRSLNTILNTFLIGFEQHISVDDRLRGNWWQIGTRTGRTSCHEPNLSNIPKISQIRNCFTAANGYLLVDADYSQIELRLAAKRMYVPTLIKAFNQGQDIHALTGSFIYDCNLDELTPEQRKLGKILNLGLIYGMGAEKFRLNAAKKFGVYLSLKRAQELREMFFALYPEINNYHTYCRRNWQQGQQQAKSTLGRVTIWSSKSPKLNQIINYPIQADCADVLKRAISNWYLESIKQQLDAHLVLTAYDQLVIEVRKEQAEYTAQVLEKIMIEAGQDILNPVPVVVDLKVSKYWS